MSPTIRRRSHHREGIVFVHHCDLPLDASMSQHQCVKRSKLHWTSTCKLHCALARGIRFVCCNVTVCSNYLFDCDLCVECSPPQQLIRRSNRSHSNCDACAASKLVDDDVAPPVPIGQHLVAVVALGNGSVIVAIRRGESLTIAFTACKKGTVFVATERRSLKRVCLIESHRGDFH